MAKQFDRIEPAHRAFIERQRVFFTGTAAPSGRVNVSPKGLDSLRVLGPDRVGYLDLAGSRRSSAAIHASSRLRLVPRSP